MHWGFGALRFPCAEGHSEPGDGKMVGCRARTDVRRARLFDEVPELYDRVRPTYPPELFADLVAITGIHEGSSVLEVGCGTGQATQLFGRPRVLGDRS